jgi:hypothetical protein
MKGCYKGIIEGVIHSKPCIDDAGEEMRGNRRGSDKLKRGKCGWVESSMRRERERGDYLLNEIWLWEHDGKRRG